MGTRSIIGIRTPDGECEWVGRYCHWDGYPEGVGAGVWHVVKRDGYATAVGTLITHNYSWSCLTTQTEPDEHEFRDSLKFVAGYGYAHTDVEPESYIMSNGDKWGTEYGYILSPEGMEILKIDWSEFTHSMGFYRWDMEGEPMFVVRGRDMAKAGA